MAKIAPFKGLRPRPELAAQVATLPYDVCSVEEARKFKDQPYNFYHVTRSEIDLSMRIDVHDTLVYEQAAENLKKFIKGGVFVQDDAPCYYIYRLTMNGRPQTGLVCISSLEDYENDIIKKHEFTRPEKELDRINHIKTTRAQTGVVLMTYREVTSVTELLQNWVDSHEAIYSFTSEDAVKHEFWVIDDYGKVCNITDIFEDDVPATYIADGHHRAASAYKVAQDYKNRNLDLTGNESFNSFLTCIFPSNQMAIMDYNRVVKDLKGYSKDEFLELLAADFIITKMTGQPYKPEKMHEFGLYLEGLWYKLETKGDFSEADTIESLDVSILQTKVLDKILGIQDPRTDDRVAFVGGIRGLEELANRVNSGEMAAAFSCYPVSMDQLLAVADNGQVMPPKSTWFEPKTRDGLIVHMI